MSTEQEVNRQVETREPLDVDAAIKKVTDDLHSMLPSTPTDKQAIDIATIVSEGTLFAQAIVKALPEDHAIPVNAVKTAIMWAKEGIMRRQEIVIVATGAPGDQAR